MYTNPHIELREDGKFYLIDMPEHPKDQAKRFGLDYYDDVAVQRYEEAKAQALKDAVEIKDKELAESLVFDNKDCFIHPAHRVTNFPYRADLSGYDVKIKNECTGSMYGKCDDRCRDCADNGIWKQVAVITPKAMKEENSAHSFTEGSEVLTTCNGRIENGRCQKCFGVAMTSSSYCGRLIPLVKQKEPEGESQEELISDLVYEHEANMHKSYSELMVLLKEKFHLTRRKK
jgi:hypothetical protein